MFPTLSGYEAYDKLSPALQKFLEGLTAVHSGEIFIEVGNLYLFFTAYSYH